MVLILLIFVNIAGLLAQNVTRYSRTVTKLPCYFFDATTFLQPLMPSSVTPERIYIRQYLKGRYHSFSLPNSQGITINSDKKIVILIGGYRSAGGTWMEPMATKYNRFGVLNILGVDWSNYSYRFYPGAVKNSKTVAELVAYWLFNILLQKDADKLKNVHLIGFSLGAHIAGFIGKSILQLTSGTTRIGRISGLDPAAPIFERPIKQPAFERLDKRDAEQVDAYHTNAGCYGFSAPLAKQDFYISYTSTCQPGCAYTSFLCSNLCNHHYSYKIFIESIGSYDYIGTQCFDEGMPYGCNKTLAIVMGENINGTSLSGSFYVKLDEDGDPI